MEPLIDTVAARMIFDLAWKDLLIVFNPIKYKDNQLSCMELNTLTPWGNSG